MAIDATAPARAAKRTDVTFLRRRSRPVHIVNPAIAEFVAGHATAHPHPAPPAETLSVSAAGRSPSARPGQASTSLDLSAPPAPAPTPTPARAPAPAHRRNASTSLDLDAPSAPPRTPAPAPQRTSATSLDLGAPAPLPPAGPPAHQPASTSLDLGAPSSPAPAPRRGSGVTSLDLSSTPTAAPASTAPRPPARAAAARTAPAWPEPRTTQGVPTMLTALTPTVTLTRLQSGIGSLTFEAVVGASVGDLRLGCAYQLRSGRSSTVQHHAGRRFAPAGETRRPIVLASRQQYERLVLDLRQVTDLERCVVYAFSGDGSQLRWGGTLIVTTFGGDRVEMPIELPPSNAVAVLASVYNLGGQLVLRSEMDLVGRSVREACRGYGFDRITWVDDVTPVD